LPDARVAVLVFVHVKLSELQHLFDANAGVAKNLNNGQAPEGVFLLLHYVDAGGVGRPIGVDRLQPGVCERVRSGICAEIGHAGDGDATTAGQRVRGVIEAAGVVVAAFGGVGEVGHFHGPDAGAFVHLAAELAAPLVVALHLVRADRRSARPFGPAGRIVVGELQQVGVEAAHAHQDVHCVASRHPLPVGELPRAQLCFPRGGDLGW
jgi:hypothetical protein